MNKSTNFQEAERSGEWLSLKITPVHSLYAMKENAAYVKGKIYITFPVCFFIPLPHKYRKSLLNWEQKHALLK